VPPMHRLKVFMLRHAQNMETAIDMHHFAAGAIAVIAAQIDRRAANCL
jgi:hypothetical protein